MTEKRTLMRRRVLSDIYWGLVLLVIGGVLLARNLGYLDFYFSFRIYWPVFLILIGLGWIVKSFESRSSERNEDVK
jgi:energy-converting hydrogenase Eha subunit C